MREKKELRLLLLLLLFACSLPFVSSQALTPPMGWNSYDGFLQNITQSQFLESAANFRKYLLPHNYEYMVVDAGWYSDLTGKNMTSDGQSRLIPNPQRWEYTRGGAGFTPITSLLHKEGVKFGIHVMRGIYSSVVEENQPIAGTPYHAKDIAVESDHCVWWPDWYGVNLSHPATQAYYDSVFQLYADWGVDYVKVDCIFGGRDGHEGDILAVSEAVSKASSTMLLSLSPGLGATPQLAEDINDKVNMYRITDDLWDCWNNQSTNPPCPYDHVTVTGAFEKFAEFQSLIGAPGLNGKSWPDGDALPFGVVHPPGSPNQMPTGLTPAEQVTLFTLWTIFRAPLIVGADLTQLDPWTIEVLTNDEVIAVHQNSSGNQQLYASSDGGLFIWGANSTTDSSKYVAFFNILDEPYKYNFELSTIGLQGTCAVRDLWAHIPIGNFKSVISVNVLPHGALLYRINNCV